MRFARTESAFPASKNLRKDVHAIAVYSKKDDQLVSLEAFIEQFKGYPVKAIYGAKSDSVA